MEHQSNLARPLDPCTFGKGGLANSLAGILNERNNRYLSNKVCGFFADYNRTLKDLDRVENFQVFGYLLRLVREDFLAKAERWADDPTLHTHMRNFLVTGYRNLLRTRTRVNQKTGRIRPVPQNILPS
jgi:hypothetical protein